MDQASCKTDQELASLYFARAFDTLDASIKMTIDGSLLIIQDSLLALSSIKIRLYPYGTGARWYIESIESFDQQLSMALQRNLASRWLEGASDDASSPSTGGKGMRQLVTVIRATAQRFCQDLIVARIRDLLRLAAPSTLVSTAPSQSGSSSRGGSNQLLTLKPIYPLTESLSPDARYHCRNGHCTHDCH